jgi:hypothetical protein
MGVGIEIIGEVGLATVAAGYVIVDHETDRTTPSQAPPNSLPYGTPEGMVIGVEREQRTETSPPGKRGVLFGPVIKDRFFRTGHQQIHIAEPSPLQGNGYLCRVGKRTSGILNCLGHTQFILSAPFQ